jgi:hypothetical protein
MISYRAMHELCVTIDYEMPQSCGFVLIVFEVSKGTIAGRPALQVDVNCNGSIQEVADEIKSAVALALHGLADQLSAETQASDGPG